MLKWDPALPPCSLTLFLDFRAPLWNHVLLGAQGQLCPKPFQLPRQPELLHLQKGLGGRLEKEDKTQA